MDDWRRERWVRKWKRRRMSEHFHERRRPGGTRDLLAVSALVAGLVVALSVLGVLPVPGRRTGGGGTFVFWLAVYFVLANVATVVLFKISGRSGRITRYTLGFGACLGLAIWLKMSLNGDRPPVTAPSPSATRELPERSKLLEEARNSTDVAPASEVRKTADSTDPFEFIRSLAKSAFDGDGRAQYLVGREYDRCEMTLSLVRKMEGDPETVIWGFPDSWPQTLKERSIAEYRRCIRLLKEDPFAELPARKAGYPPKYWMQRSAEAGYPLAVAERSLAESLRSPGEAAAPGKLSVESVDELTKATMSGDPDVALTIGFRQSWFDDPARTTAASAWMLAACRMGADCGANSKVYPFFMCYDPERPNCDKDGNVELVVSTSLSPEKYADAYAQSQVIEEALRNRDSAALKSLLEKFAR